MNPLSHESTTYAQLRPHLAERPEPTDAEISLAAAVAGFLDGSNLAALAELELLVARILDIPLRRIWQWTKRFKEPTKDKDKDKGEGTDMATWLQETKEEAAKRSADTAATKEPFDAG